MTKEHETNSAAGAAQAYWAEQQAQDAGEEAKVPRFALNEQDTKDLLSFIKSEYSLDDFINHIRSIQLNPQQMMKWASLRGKKDVVLFFEQNDVEYKKLVKTGQHPDADLLSSVRKQNKQEPNNKGIKAVLGHFEYLKKKQREKRKRDNSSDVNNTSNPTLMTETGVQDSSAKKPRVA